MFLGSVSAKFRMEYKSEDGSVIVTIILAVEDDNGLEEIADLKTEFEAPQASPINYDL